MHKAFLNIAAILGILSVMLGAFAAHALKSRLPGDYEDVFQTAVRYQFYHTLALLAVGILFEKFPNARIRWAGYCFITGIVLFCGSLYLMSVLRAANLTGLGRLGIITPFGGAFFIVGWLLILLGVSKKHSSFLP
ncbi:MAG TPA: DUF423 domain-containing protein [Puia sp.]|nr:DUF423 domain-containing protein [Puia sp.]